MSNEEEVTVEKTRYEWCLEKNIKVIGLEKDKFNEHNFYTADCTEDQFEDWLKVKKETKVLEVSTGLHFKSDKYLELRMYTLVPYNLLGIQKGIQHEHSNTQYVKKFLIEQVESGGEMDPKYVLWAKEWNTSILLNGGTSNEGHWVRQGFRQVWYEGSMQKHLKTLQDMKIKVSTFYEPDLNSMLTGISFIVDERVFNRRMYPYFNFPDFRTWIKGYQGEWINDADMGELYGIEKDKAWEEYLEMVGGEQNHKLKEFLRGLNLA